MSDMKKVFYDGMGTVRMADGVVHMEFFNLTADEKKEPAGELVLSQRAFLRAFAAMENLIGQLEAAVD